MRNDLWQLMSDDEDARETLIAAAEAGGRLDIAQLEALPCGTAGAETVRSAGLAEQVQLDGSLVLNKAGKRAASEVLSDVMAGSLRFEALRLELLRLTRDARGARFTSDDAMARLSVPRRGEPWGTEEVRKAVAHLKEEGLIQAQGTWQGVWFIHGITGAGQVALNPARRAAPAQHIDQSRNIMIGTNQGNVASGDYATQTVNLVSHDDVLRTLAFARSHVDDLPREVQADAREAVSEASDALALSTPDVEHAVSALERFRVAAGNVANSTILSNFLAVLSLVIGVLKP